MEKLTESFKKKFVTKQLKEFKKMLKGKLDLLSSKEDKTTFLQLTAEKLSQTEVKPTAADIQALKELIEVGSSDKDFKIIVH